MDVIIDRLVKFHNYDKKIPIYKLVPIDISREDVESINTIKREHNTEFNSTFDFVVGDVVHVLLLRDKLEKQRERKWSRGTY